MPQSYAGESRPLVWAARGHLALCQNRLDARRSRHLRFLRHPGPEHRDLRHGGAGRGPRVLAAARRQVSLVERRPGRDRTPRAFAQRRALPGLAAGPPGRVPRAGHRITVHTIIDPGRHRGASFRATIAGLPGGEGDTALVPRAGPPRGGLLELGLGARRSPRRGGTHAARRHDGVVSLGGRSANHTRGSTSTPCRDAGTTAAAAVFVGDSWGPDVEGPRAAGIRPAYLAARTTGPTRRVPRSCPRGSPSSTISPVCSPSSPTTCRSRRRPERRRGCGGCVRRRQATRTF